MCGLYVWLVCQYLYSMACYTCINDQKFPIWGNRMLPKFCRFFLLINIWIRMWRLDCHSTKNSSEEKWSTLAHAKDRRRATRTRVWCWWRRCRWWASTATAIPKHDQPSAGVRTSTSRTPTRMRRCVWRRRCWVWGGIADLLCMSIYMVCYTPSIFIFYLSS